jgi:hypothetical protein
VIAHVTTYIVVTISTIWLDIDGVVSSIGSVLLDKCMGTKNFNPRGMKSRSWKKKMRWNVYKWGSTKSLCIYIHLELIIVSDNNFHVLMHFHLMKTEKPYLLNRIIRWARWHIHTYIGWQYFFGVRAYDTC